MCRHACPVGHVTHRETLTPHAWALTIESVKRGQLEWNDESVAVLYACADCGLCQSHCATDQPLPDAIAAARAEVVAAGKAPSAVYELDERLRQMERPAAIPAGSAHSVALFVGEHDEATVDAALRLLSAAGVREIARVGGGRSTGAVAASLGLREAAVACGDALIAELKASDAFELLVLTPADRWTFEHVYSKRLGLSWPEPIAVREVTSVLAGAAESGTLTFRRAVAHANYAYHDPCHSARIGRDDREPRALLEAALGKPGQTMFWRERRAHPCGATSGLDITHPQIAGKLAAARLADAVGAGAKTLITDDPSCLRHLRAHATDGVQVVGMYELLAERI
jgi:Fe-S oxidoreductase